VGVEIPNAIYNDAKDHDGKLFLTFEVSMMFYDEIQAILGAAIAKYNRYVRLRLDTPHKPRSTGPRSTNNRIRGHCADITEQLNNKGKAENISEEEVYAAMKRMSVESGYPTYLSMDGTEQPLPMHNASEEQALIVCKTINKFADVHGMWLTEYDDSVKPPIAYRSTGGRSRQEMEELNEMQDMQSK
jgi:hypothetical protein